MREHLGAVAAGDLHLLLAGQPEQRQRGGDLGEGVVVDVVPGVEGGLVRDAGDLAEPAGRVRVGDLPARRGPQHAAGLDRVGREEREQLGDGPQVVVDQTGSHHGRAPGGSAPVAVGRVGVPAPERRGLLGRGRRVAQDVAGVGRRSPTSGRSAADTAAAPG